MAAIGYYILQTAIIRGQGPDSFLGRAAGGDLKGKSSLVLYAIAIPAAFVQVWIAYAVYVAVAVIWLVPDKRIERALKAEGERQDRAGGHAAGRSSHKAGE